MTSRIGIQSGQVMSIQLSYPDFSDPVTPDPGTVPGGGEQDFLCY